MLPSREVRVICRSGDDSGVEIGTVRVTPDATLEAFRAMCIAEALPLPERCAFLSLQGQEVTGPEEQTQRLEQMIDARTQAVWVQAARAPAAEGAPPPAPQAGPGVARPLDIVTRSVQIPKAAEGLEITLRDGPDTGGVVMATVPNGTSPGRGKLPSSVATFSPPPQLSLSPQLAQGEPSSKSPGKPASQRDGRNGHSAQPPPPPPTPQRSNGSPMPPTPPNPTSASGGGGDGAGAVPALGTHDASCGAGAGVPSAGALPALRRAPPHSGGGAALRPEELALLPKVRVRVWVRIRVRVRVRVRVRHCYPRCAPAVILALTPTPTLTLTLASTWPCRLRYA